MALPWIHPLVDLAQKAIQMCVGHEFFIPSKFGKYPLNYSVVKAVYVFPYMNMH